MRPDTNPSGKTPAPNPVNPSSQKYSTLPKFGIAHILAIPARWERGDRTSSRTWAGVRWTRQRRRGCGGRAGSPVSPNPCRRAALSYVSPEFLRRVRLAGVALWRKRIAAYGKTVWSWLSLLQPSFREDAYRPTGRGASSIREVTVTTGTRRRGEHGIRRQTIAQGRPSVRRHLYAAVRSPCATLSRSGPRVPVGTRSSLRPLHGGGRRRRAKLGRFTPRECRFMRDFRVSLKIHTALQILAYVPQRVQPRTRCLSALPARLHSVSQ